MVAARCASATAAETSLALGSAEIRSAEELVNRQSLAARERIALEAAHIDNAGVIEAGVEPDERYDLSYQGNNLTITKALLNVIADAKTKVYGDADPSLTYQVSGLKNGFIYLTTVSRFFLRNSTASSKPWGIALSSIVISPLELE